MTRIWCHKIIKKRIGANLKYLNKLQAKLVGRYRLVFLIHWRFVPACPKRRVFLRPSFPTTHKYTLINSLIILHITHQKKQKKRRNWPSPVNCIVVCLLSIPAVPSKTCSVEHSCAYIINRFIPFQVHAWTIFVLTCTTALSPSTSRICPRRVVPSDSVKFTISWYFGPCHKPEMLNWGR